LSNQADHWADLRNRICDQRPATSSLRKNIPQPALQDHLGWTAAGGFKPIVEIPYLHTMLDFGLSDAHRDAGGKSESHHSNSRKTRRGLGDGFEDALSADLDRVLDALRITAGDLAGADRHVPKTISFVFYSPTIELGQSANVTCISELKQSSAELGASAIRMKRAKL
jgi:hypothetical protein